MIRKILILVFLNVVLIPPLIFAQKKDSKPLEIIHAKPGTYVCPLPVTDTNAHFFLRSNPEVLERVKNKANTTFEVDYSSSCGNEEWPAEAMNAFEFALAIWAEHINTDVSIKVDANWISLDENTLGSARPSQVVQITGIGEPDTWYALAHLSAISGSALRDRLNDTDYDIDMNVQCDYDDWYFGTDANVPENKSDFVTVVLHEIGHGLGFLGSMEGDSNAETAEWSVGDEGDPLIYDRFTVDGDFDPLINTSVYSNPSTELYEALTGKNGGIYFEGPDANVSLEDYEADRARLYSPDPFNEGSSYSHFDQTTFRKTVNALMLPFISRTFAVHTPGPLFCGVLSDMGWPLGDGCLDFIPSSILLADAEEVIFGVLNEGESIEKSFVITNRSDAEKNLEGSLAIDNDNYSIVGDINLDVAPGMSREIIVEYHPQENRRHSATLSIIHNAPNEVTPLEISLEGEALGADQVVELDQSYPNPFVANNSQNLAEPTIEYAIARNSEVKLDLYTISGKHIYSLVNAQQDPARYQQMVDMSGLSSGIYIYRIVVDGVAKSGKLMYVR